MISETLSELDFSFSDMYFKANMYLSFPSEIWWPLGAHSEPSSPLPICINSDIFIQILHECISNTIS